VDVKVSGKPAWGGLLFWAEYAYNCYALLINSDGQFLLLHFTNNGFPGWQRADEKIIKTGVDQVNRLRVVLKDRHASAYINNQPVSQFSLSPADNINVAHIGLFAGAGSAPLVFSHLWIETPNGAYRSDKSMATPALQEDKGKRSDGQDNRALFTTIIGALILACFGIWIVRQISSQRNNNGGSFHKTRTGTTLKNSATKINDESRMRENPGKSDATDQTTPRNSKARVFVGHTSKDKPFVRKLFEALKGRNLNVWLDERELQVGDSIVAGVSQGLKNSDYLVAVLSKASIGSRWVQAELNAALMEDLSGKGITVLPVLIEDCELPTLLKDRVYADFRYAFNDGLQKLLAVFEQEGESIANVAPEAATEATPCSQKLSAITLADLRRLLIKAKSRNNLPFLMQKICQDRSDLADP
jgi:hypothetical protein